ncbi:substrate-binding domain-containing protein [Microbacterium sp. X-17]|uniref:sugar ABC transporter substrate-binding protein n=1 Tax=Microbacterium sp. X-17 TaxID=3144404 RepID=UPI0031F4F37D
MRNLVGGDAASPRISTLEPPLRRRPGRLLTAKRALAALSLAAAAMVALSACAAGAAAAPTAGASGAANGANAQVVADAQARLEPYLDASKLDWPKPSQPFAVGTGRVAIITCGVAGVACAVAADNAVEAATAAGWTPSPVFDGKFSPSVQAGYIEQAVQQGYDAIILMAIEPSSVQAAILDANRAGIPIACMNCKGDLDGKVITIHSDSAAAGAAIADQAIVDSGGAVKGTVFQDPAYPANSAVNQAQLDQFKKYCPGCDVKGPIDTSTADITGPNPKIFTGALAANPPGSLPYVFAPYDPAALQFIKTLQSQGRTDVKVAGNDAVPQTLAGMAGCDCFLASTAGPFSYEAWAAMDEVARAKAGVPTWDATTLPFVLVTKDNIAKYSTDFVTPEFDFKAMFKEQWGK